MARSETPVATGRVLHVNVSGGGVPKRPVEEAWVTRLGLEGDAQAERTVHGGPHKAVSLFAIEAIERMQSEGHPIEPGSAGENLTTTGIEWSLLPVGTRARVGDSLQIELASPAMPCAKQRRNFIDGRFSRLSIDLHPADSRMYARVLNEGPVRAGDPIELFAPSPDSRAAELLLLKRLDRVERKSSVASWRAAAECGFGIEIVEDGDLAMSSAPTLAGPAFNHASGLAQYPNLLDMVTAFYDARASWGWLWTEDAPWPGPEPTATLGVYAADPRQLEEEQLPKDVDVRLIGPEDATAFSSVRVTSPEASGLSDRSDDPWEQVYARLASWPHRYMFLAEMDGVPAGGASLHVHAGTGWLRGAMVAPAMRGRGVQRALIKARVEHALAIGCDLVGSWAEPDTASAANLTRMGLRRIGTRTQYLYAPETPGSTE